MMATTTALTYVLIVCYFIVERLLRKGAKALSLQPGEFDRDSSKVILTSGLLTMLLILVAPILNANGMGYWNIGYGCWIGILLMLVGLVLRSWAAVSLGEFYTRTLQILDGQKIIDKAPYNIIRHPGYAGTFLMEIGAGLAVSNGMILVAVLIIGGLSRLYRIEAEEQMLAASLKEQYQVYLEKTWKLIPFIY